MTGKENQKMLQCRQDCYFSVKTASKCEAARSSDGVQSRNPPAAGRAAQRRARSARLKSADAWLQRAGDR